MTAHAAPLYFQLEYDTMKWKLQNAAGQILYFKTLAAARHYAQHNGTLSIIDKVK